MLTDDEIKRAMDNCDLLRRLYPVRFLQVMPAPRQPDNVQLRIGRGPWCTLHFIDAKVYLLCAIRRQRSDAKLDKTTKQLRRSIKVAKAKRVVREARERFKRRMLDDDVRETIKATKSLLKTYR